MTDVLVLDEADRMIQDGHFKELADILAHIYTTRLQMKTKKIDPEAEEKQDKLKKMLKDNENSDEEVVEIGASKDVDWSKVKDLFDDQQLVDEVEEQGFNFEEPKEKKENKRQ